ncbi:MAG TPA: FAD:protein FMN transferase [Solirubrobacteraceae bacterium]|nr:FAD:protein FMN transferase [Solirubrobacteraceae bacterium]
MAIDASTHLFWITSRAAGTTALIFASASVGYGLMMGGKLIKGSNADRRVIHEVLALCTMLAIAVHGLALFGDSYLHPSMVDITVPFAMPYSRIFTTLGIIAGWSLILLGLSFYFRARIGMSRWKVIHRFTLLARLGGAEIERAGYARHFDADPVPLTSALALAPPRTPAAPHPPSRWRSLRVDPRAGTLSRPPGLRLDGGGIAKGLFADVLAQALARHLSFAVDCGGDMRLGGRDGVRRPVLVESPFDGTVIHRFERSAGAVATSGIGRRSWLDPCGRPAHHLLDPVHGTARLHRHRPGHRPRADGAGGGDALEGGAARRSGQCRGMASPRGRGRLRRRQLPRAHASC